MANKEKGLDQSWITWFTFQWNDITSRLKKFEVKEEKENEEQCIQSECEHNQVD